MATTANHADNRPESLENQVRRAILWRSGSQIFAQAVQWAATFLVIRILDPRDYGLYAMTSVVLVFLNMLNGYGLASGLIQRDDVTPHQTRQLFGMLIALIAAACSTPKPGTPEFVAKHPRYERVGLKDLCTQIHEVYKANDVARLTTEMYLSDMQPAMKPSDAFARLAHREIDRVEIDQLEGRVTSVLLTPYPPGIPLLIPGERFNRRIVEYLRFTREFNARFPGFDTDVHGLVENETEGFQRMYYVDCVRQ